MEPEIIEIGANDGLKSANFGGGIELLMNDKKKEKSGGESTNIDLNDLDNLESELNDLVGVTDNNEAKPIVIDSFSEEPLTVKFDDLDSSKVQQPPTIGEATRDSGDNMKTWDGFAQFNDIPVTPNVDISKKSSLSKEETLREKFNYLRKLEALEKKGVELTKKYNMDSNLTEMMGEYDMVMSEKERQNSIKFQGNMLAALINGVEFLNGKFDPFDIKLDGWGEQFSENISDYDEIFAELHEKYKSTAQMAPEIKLLFQLGASGMMVHMTNTMFKSSMPNMDDVLRQNPDLMQEFNRAAVNSMGNTNPGFSGFMNNVMNPEPQPAISRNRGPPPPPMATQEMPPPQRRNSTFNQPESNRPDIRRAKGLDDAVPVNDFSTIEESLKSIPAPPARSSTRRPEMKGPSDISDLLGGLKQKPQTPQTPKSMPTQPPSLLTKSNLRDPFANDKDLNVTPTVSNTREIKDVRIPQIQPEDAKTEEGSTISLNDLRELQMDATGPKKTKRRKGSDKNTVSLDI